jgi:hypothetical protein
MRFSILTVQASREAELPKNTLPFHWVIHHVKEIYLKMFPKNIEVNNSSKIAIEYGPQGDEPVFDNVLGVTSYFVEDFNFDAFYKLNNNDRENMILDSINNVILDIIKRTIQEKNILDEIENVANKVKESKFNMEIEVKKISKITVDKKYKINIFRVLNKEVGEGWKYKKIDRKTKMVVEENWLKKVPDYLDRTDYYKKAEISETEYIIYDNLNWVAYKMGI